MVGSRGCNNEVVVDALKGKGFDVDYDESVKIPSLTRIGRAEVIYGAYLQTCSRYVAAAQTLGKKTIIHFVGSDAYRYAREKGLRKLFWASVVRASDLILYVSPHLSTLVGRPGATLPFPIRIESFKKPAKSRYERDTLYYCPGGAENARIYRLDWILDYATQHSEEKITIIGNTAHPADYNVNLPNVEVVPFVTYDRMADLYARHRGLIRMTTEDGQPRMVDEAILSGLQVIFNGKKIQEVPPERDPTVFAKRFEQELLKIL
jgi:hypothetical protein